MDPVLIARIQFGLSLGFHYLFPQTTLGLCLIIMLAEWKHWLGREETWRRISDFAVRLLAVVFAFGVATGLVMPFTFGMHWSGFSMTAAAVFGPVLALEAMLAFALESPFLSILIFGRKRVSRTFYLVSACLVFLGSHLSALLIVSVNSWMETPAGYALENGKIVLTDWVAAVFNPSFPARIMHTITAAWISGAFFFMALIAWNMLRRKKIAAADTTAELAAEEKAIRKNEVRAMSLAATVALSMSLLQPVLGHMQIMDVLKNQPMKNAAYEGIFQGQNGAPLIGFGIPDADNNRILLPLAIPKALSFLESGNFNSYVRGLNEFPRETWPPVNLIFTTFHIMVPLAGVCVVGAFFAFLFSRKSAKKALADRRLFLAILIPAAAAPYLANELGWIGAEIGRQPWAIYGLLKTTQGVTPGQGVPATGFTLILFGLAYILLAILAVRFILAAARKGM